MSLRSTPKLVKQLCSVANELEYMQEELGLKNEYIRLVDKRLNSKSLKINKCLICGKELTKEETKNMFGFSVCCDD